MHNVMVIIIIFFLCVVVVVFFVCFVVVTRGACWRASFLGEMLRVESRDEWHADSKKQKKKIEP